MSRRIPIDPVVVSAFTGGALGVAWSLALRWSIVDEPQIGANVAAMAIFLLVPELRERRLETGAPGGNPISKLGMVGWVAMCVVCCEVAFFVGASLVSNRVARGTNLTELVVGLVVTVLVAAVATYWRPLRRSGARR